MITFLKELWAVVDFCAIYFSTILGRCAILAYPVWFIVKLLRSTILKDKVVLREAAWGLFLVIPFLGRLKFLYKCPIINLWYVGWQQYCTEYWVIRYMYLIGIVVFIIVRHHKFGSRKKMWGILSETKINGKKVYLSDKIVTPLATGLVFPKIVLPRAMVENLSENDLDIILLHEKTHIQLGHLWLYAFLYWMAALLWINPLLRECASEARGEMEYICDRVVVRRSGKSRREYLMTILRSLSYEYWELPDTVATFVGERHISEFDKRIDCLVNYQPCKTSTLLLRGICCAGILLAFPVMALYASYPQYTKLNNMVITDETGKIVASNTMEDFGRVFRVEDDTITIDNREFCAILPAGTSGRETFEITWGGFMKLPELSGWENHVRVEGLSDGTETTVKYRHMENKPYVRLMELM